MYTVNLLTKQINYPNVSAIGFVISWTMVQGSIVNAIMKLLDKLDSIEEVFQTTFVSIISVVTYV